MRRKNPSHTGSRSNSDDRQRQSARSNRKETSKAGGNERRPRHDDPARNQRTISTPGIRGTILYGHHAVESAWHNPERQIHAVYVAENSKPEWLIKALAHKPANRPAPLTAPRHTLDQMCHEGVHQGIVADVSPLPQPDLLDVLAQYRDDQTLTLMMLDQVSDPQNIGSILRAAAAFGAAAVIAQSRHAPDVTATMAKIASGAVEHVPYIQVTNLSRCLEQLADQDIMAIGFDERGTTIMGQTNLPARHVLVMGAEGSGLRRLVAEHCQQIMRLPTRPPIASLNVAQAATIALYEATRTRPDSGTDR